MSKLTPKQQAFVDEYLLDFNATQAAIRAGYSKHTAAEIAHENLRKPQIQAALAEAFKKRREKLQLEADDVLRLLIREAAGHGPDTSSTARIRAAELLGKHLGIFQSDAAQIDQTLVVVQRKEY